jgi:polyhydroxyalkanoate synthesis regulator phasin
MNYNVDSEKLISLETVEHIEKLIDELVDQDRLVIRYDQQVDLLDDVLEAIRVEIRKYVNS